MNENKKFRICIVGGGSRYTPGILKMLVAEKDRFPISTIVLYDNEAERQERVCGYGKVLLREYYPECEIIHTTDPETAFTGIDFAFMQIRAGRLKMRESDEKIALKHGCIGQETCGAGGFAYGMRSVPAVCAIIKDIRKYAPEPTPRSSTSATCPSASWACTPRPSASRRSSLSPVTLALTTTAGSPTSTTR